MGISLFTTKAPFWVGLLILVLGAGPAFAAPKKAAKKLGSAQTAPGKKSGSISVPEELLEIEKRYVAAKTLEANFAQRDEVKLTGAKKQSSGILMIRHPNQFRWETLSPDKNLLVSDGRKFWFYTPPFEAGERGQVIERKTTEVQSELANYLLAGAFSKLRGVTLKKLSPTRFQLIPSAGIAGSVKNAVIEINADEKTIQKLELEHSGGNKTEIVLSKVKLGGPLADAFFKFVTPPDTDVLRE